MVLRWCVTCRRSVELPHVGATCPHVRPNPKPPPPAVVCIRCGEVEPYTSIQTFGGCGHIRADCPKCGRFIRFLPSR